MVVNKTDWSDLIGSELSPVSIGAGVETISSNLDVTPYIKVSFRIYIFFHASTEDILISIRNAESSPDTVPIWKQRVNRLVEDARIITISNLDVMALDSLSVTALNEDASESVEAWISWMAASTSPASF